MRHSLRICLLTAVLQVAHAADLSGTWVGTWQVNGVAEPFCLALISGDQTASAQIAYLEDKAYERLSLRPSDNRIQLELPDPARGPIRLDIRIDGTSLSGEVLLNQQRGTIAARKFTWPSSTYRFGKGPGAPTPIRRGPPPSPPESAATVQGDVLLEVQVLSNGTVAKNIQVTKGLGPGFDQRAIEYVRTWEFTPPHEDCSPGPRVRVSVSFRRL